MLGRMLMWGMLTSSLAGALAAAEEAPGLASGNRTARDRLLISRALAKQSGLLGEQARRLEQLAETLAPSVKGGGQAALFEEAKIALAALRRDLKPLLPKGNRFEPLLNSAGHLERIRRAASDAESLYRLGAKVENLDPKLALAWRRRVVHLRNELQAYAVIADEWDRELGNEPIELFEVDDADLSASDDEVDDETLGEENRQVPAVPRPEETAASGQGSDPDGPADGEDSTLGPTAASSSREVCEDEQVMAEKENIIEDDSVDDLELPEMPDEEVEPRADPGDDED